MSSEEEILATFDQAVEDAEAEFSKPYSQDNLVRLRAHVATCKMIVENLYLAAANEEDGDRKDSVIQKMVLAGRNMSEARDAVERGER